MVAQQLKLVLSLFNRFLMPGRIHADVNTIFVLKKRAIRTVYDSRPMASLRKKFKIACLICALGPGPACAEDGRPPPPCDGNFGSDSLTCISKQGAYGLR
ncbi:hypothetical protein EVAR_60819_1 [Eumeta japonica]|uniref:Uncharacterized protein n=1 Tax=Eumeta variegata TaxID=151549 RepID=A0A4C1ZY77_EUMVA|nr:hypothetical protein EVAR_60819_1 [Eumeta japonica]